MSKYLTVVAFALFVLTGAMGLRNVVSASGLPMPGTGGGRASGLPMPGTGGGRASGLPMPGTGGGR